MKLIICDRCGYPKEQNEPEDGICIGHVAMADIFTVRLFQQPVL